MDVRFLGIDFNGDPFDDLQAIAFDPHDLPGVIRHKTDLPESQTDQDLRADTVIPQVRFKSRA